MPRTTIAVLSQGYCDDQRGHTEASREMERTRTHDVMIEPIYE